MDDDVKVGVGVEVGLDPVDPVGVGVLVIVVDEFVGVGVWVGLDPDAPVGVGVEVDTSP